MHNLHTKTSKGAEFDPVPDGMLFRPESVNCWDTGAKKYLMSELKQQMQQIHKRAPGKLSTAQTRGLELIKNLIVHREAKEFP